MFSFPVMLAVGLCLVAVVTVSGRFYDPDMWWHLKIGQVIWTTHEIPARDQFSFTAYGHPWIAHEWLAQLSIYAAYLAGAYRGMMLWLASTASLLLVLVYGLCYLRTRNAFIAFLCGMGAWLFSTVGLAVRPLLLGHVFLACELILLELGQRDRRWLWGLPPLFALWVNSHGSFLFGLFALGVYWICAVTGAGWGPISSKRWDKAGVSAFSIVVALSIAALFCNPVGWRLVTYPLDTMFLQKTNLNAVQEWFPPELHDSRAIALLVSLCVIAITPLWRKAHYRTQDLALVLPAFYLAFQHTRMLIMFGVVAMPVLACVLSPLLREERKNDIPAANGVLIAAFVAVMAWAFPSAQALSTKVKETTPANAIEYIRKAGLRGPILNEYSMGGYLIWTFPEEKVFIDGRGDIYDWSGVLARYGKWATLSESPDILLNQYHVRLCLLNRASPLSNVLRFMPGWRESFSDDVSIVYVRN